MKTEAQKKKEAKERAARELQRTKKKLGLGEPEPLKGATTSPLTASSRGRRPKPAPTSDHIPGSAPAADLLHAHKWKRGVKETQATTTEMRRKAARIAPAYNKGALQYLPGGLDQWPAREEMSGRAPPKKR